MANGIDWFRWHHGSVNDPKFGLVAKKAGAHRGDVIAVWALVLELASANTNRGQVGEIDHEATDFLLGAEDGTTARILEAMQSRGLIAEGRVVRWDDRQPKRERVDTTAAERKRAQRERDRDGERDNERDDDKDGEVAYVTPSHTVSHQVTPREEKSREELKTPHTPQGGQPVEQDEIEERKAAISLKTFLEECRKAGEQPIPNGDPVFEYADKIGLPHEFLALMWKEFKDRYTKPGAKRYKAWRQVFRRAVQANWLKLWWLNNDGQYVLTTAGLQAQRSHKEAA